MKHKFKSIILLACCAALIIGVSGCSGDKKIKDVPVSEIAEEVQKAYGDQYVATYQFTDDELQELIGVDPKDCEEYIAFGPMMSTHVDKFIAIKAKSDKKETVKAALEAHQTSLKEDTLQYPMNIPKIQASEIREYGDYLFFIMLGFPEDDTADEEELLAQFQEQNAIAVKVIEDLLYGVQ